MTDLLTAMHLSVMLLDLKIRMMEAINEERFDLANESQGLGHL